jgi:hypothetical protein
VECAGLSAFLGGWLPILELGFFGIAGVLMLYMVEGKLNWVVYIACNSNKPQMELRHYCEARCEIFPLFGVEFSPVKTDYLMVTNARLKFERRP